MAELTDSCVKPVRGPITPAASPQSGAATLTQEVQKSDRTRGTGCTGF
jgi:hypothetical protein